MEVHFVARLAAFERESSCFLFFRNPSTGRRSSQTKKSTGHHWEICPVARAAIYNRYKVWLPFQQ